MLGMSNCVKLCQGGSLSLDSLVKSVVLLSRSKLKMLR